MSKIVCLPLKKLPTVLSNPLSFYVSRGTICGIKFSLWKISCVLFVIVGQWAKNFPFPAKIFQQGLRMSCIHVHNNLFMERYFEKKNFKQFLIMITLFRLFNRIFPTALSNSFLFYVSRGHWEEKHFFWKKVFFPTSFGHWAKFFAFLSNILKRVVKTEFSVYGRAFCLDFFFLKKYLYSIFLGHWKKLFEVFGK